MTSTCDEILKDAARRFPSGTRFTSLFGAVDTVAAGKTDMLGRKREPYSLGEFNDVFAQCESGQTRMLYDAGADRWADPHAAVLTNLPHGTKSTSA
jgi:hypothetical protein